MKQEDLIRRRVYGRRQGHKLRANQQELMQHRLDEYRVKLTGDSQHELFSFVPNKLILEIGFGGGEHLLERASADKESGFIGCEPFINGVAKLLSQIVAQDIKNIRIHDDDARNLMDVLPSSCLDHIYLLYPDPWPKSRHHRRRFVNQDNLSQFFRLLKPKGRVTIASDISDYIFWSLSQIRLHGGFIWQVDGVDDWRCSPQDWTPTRYEIKAKEKGVVPSYLQFCKAGEVKRKTL